MHPGHGRPVPEPVRALVRRARPPEWAVDCPHCGVTAGHPCRAPSRRILHTAHASRRAAAGTTPTTPEMT